MQDHTPDDLDHKLGLSRATADAVIKRVALLFGLIMEPVLLTGKEFFQ